jgi:hypothetical protein
VIQLVRLLHFNGKKIIILSGRVDRVKAKTERWLEENKVPFTALVMRSTKDRTQDDELKLKWIKAMGISERIWMVLEDRSRVVKAWREAGFTCLQVAPGEF